jgi:type II secretory pathway predicted ATPase ExeA
MKSEPQLSVLARQWGATAVPFGLVNSEDWLETPEAQKALTCLNQSAALRSVMLLSGPNGVGKSALVGRWMRGLDTRLFCPVCLTQATLSGTAVLAALASKLGKAASFQRRRNLQLIEEALQEVQPRIVVLILDEAQNYSQPSLEEVRLLLGLNLPQQPAFALGLCLLARAAWIAAATAHAQTIAPAHVQAALEQVPCVPGLMPSPPNAPS